MSKAKKVFLTCTAYVLVAVIAIGATLAYLTDTDSEVNVMTVGNVKIEQIEQERIDKTKLPTAEGNLQNFKQKKTLLPAVFEGASIPWDAESVSNQAWKIVDRNNENVLDKFVTVKNTGKSDAYVRTIIAYEGDATYGPAGEYIHIVVNTTNVDPQIASNWVGTVTINGVDYTVVEYTYPAALAAGEISIPSLKQVYMNKAATNEIVAHYGDTYDILVLSQAVQAAGFSNAKTALDEAFGKTAEKAAAWFAGMGTAPQTPAAVAVNAANIASMDFTQDNVTYKFSGTFAEDVTISVPKGLTQTFDGTGAVFGGNLVIDSGVADPYSGLNAARSGNLTITNFEAETLNVNAINKESVTITNNTVHALSVVGGNFELVIDGNSVDGNEGQYATGNNQHNTVDYGISLRITDYELSVTDNVITDTYSHAIGINGRQGDGNGADDWLDCGTNNVVKAFTGNTITVNSTKKTQRAALKIWNDKVYAPYGTSGQQPNAKATALMETIKADTTNVFTLGDGHTTFNIYDYKE